ncbi:hypothetical protein SK128_018260 [Halocaridina rubra]|uniref:Serpin domain-containing protein n=1 Tax=Halocaridina rubra TaxID=373956 RepID=A0AAN8X5V1_HALRR
MKAARPSARGPEFPPYEHQEAVTSLAKSQNNFTRDLYVKLAKQSTGNLFFSPFSVMTALGMTLAGARGNTKTEMCNILHVSEDDESLHEAFSEVVNDIKKEVPEYELRTANMAYVSDKLKVLQEYADLLTGKYLSTSEVVDFDDEPPVRTKINEAVEKETNSKIKDLIAPGVLNPDTRMVLVNAIYFKGLWENQFNESKTEEKDFWISATESVKVPMMTIKKKFGYQINRDLGATLLKMSYKGSRLSMVFVLPDKRDGLADVEAKLAQTDFSELDNRMRDIEIEVTIPKFKLEESLDLESHLSEMGMKDLFSEVNADLSGISGTRDLYVSKVIHKAFIEVNEKGSEAAAATAVVVLLRCYIPPADPFLADHPFVFYIIDNNNGLLYFIGRLRSI